MASNERYRSTSEQPNSVRLALPANSQEHREITDHLIKSSDELMIFSPATALYRVVQGVSTLPQPRGVLYTARDTIELHSAIMESGKFHTKLFAPNATLTNRGENLYNTDNELPDFWTLNEVAPGESHIKSHPQFIAGIGKLLSTLPRVDALYSEELLNRQHITNHAMNEALWDDLTALAPSQWTMTHRYATDIHQHTEPIHPRALDDDQIDGSYAANVGSVVKVVTTQAGYKYSVQVSATIPVRATPSHLFSDDNDVRAAVGRQQASVRKTLELSAETNRHHALREDSITASVELESSRLTRDGLLQIASHEPLRQLDGILAAETYMAAIDRVTKDRLP